MIDELANEIELMGRHVEILRVVSEDEPIGIARLSRATGYPRHKVRYSLRVLERSDLVEPTQRGAVTTDRTGPLADEYAERIDDVVDRLSDMTISHEPRPPEP